MNTASPPDFHDLHGLLQQTAQRALLLADCRTGSEAEVLERGRQLRLAGTSPPRPRSRSYHPAIPHP